MLLSEIQDITSAFNAVSLSEMDKVKLMKRVDTKFALSEKNFKNVFINLKDEYNVLEVNNDKFSEYESLYFDQSDLIFYKDHHRGKANRLKIRIRKYKSNDLSFLEVKKKHKGQTIKSRIPSKSWSENFTKKECEFLDPLYPNHSNLIPSLENKFVRITLVHKENIERLTFDLNLSYKKDGQTIEMENLVVCELKQEKINRLNSFYNAMKKQLVRPLRVSKYCLGIMEFYSSKQVKSNRFKKKTLQLKKTLC